MTGRGAAVAVAVAVVVACSEPHRFEDASCPPRGTTLTYEEFGAPFLGAYCQTAACHGAAPNGITFATHDDVLRWGPRIYENAAGRNTYMPPGPDGPPLEERELLAEWLACGAP